MDAVHAGGLGGTYGGNPVACAAALGAIEEMRTHDLAARARDDRGADAGAGSRRSPPKHPVIGDIRGRGAMMAIELCRARHRPTPTPRAPAAVAAYCHQQRRRHADLRHLGQRASASCPRSSITDELLDEAFDVVAEAFAATA